MTVIATLIMVSQLTLSLYLITLCQLKLRHSVTSVAQTPDYTKVAHRKLGVRWTLERLILKMTAQKAPDLGVLETESWSRDPFLQVLVSVLVLEPQSQVDLRTTDAEDDCTEGSRLGVLET